MKGAQKRLDRHKEEAGKARSARKTRLIADLREEEEREAAMRREEEREATIESLPFVDFCAELRCVEAELEARDRQKDKKDMVKEADQRQSATPRPKGKKKGKAPMHTAEQADLI